MTPLSSIDRLHLKAAEGWLELGNCLESNEELERIAPQVRAHPEVLEIRFQIYSKTEKWDACLEIASTMIKLTPECSEAWLHRSCALHRLRRTQEAFDNLVSIAERFPKVWRVPYDLACYCARLGRIAEAQEWFSKAMAVDENAVRRLGIDDPDLNALWDSLSTKFRKRDP